MEMTTHPAQNKPPYSCVVDKVKSYGSQNAEMEKKKKNAVS